MTSLDWTLYWLTSDSFCARMNLKAQVKLVEVGQHVPTGRQRLKNQTECEGHTLPGAKHTGRITHKVTEKEI